VFIEKLLLHARPGHARSCQVSQIMHEIVESKTGRQCSMIIPLRLAICAGWMCWLNSRSRGGQFGVTKTWDCAGWCRLTVDTRHFALTAETAEQGVGIEHDAGRLEDWVAFESGLARSCKVSQDCRGKTGCAVFGEYVAATRDLRRMSVLPILATPAPTFSCG